MSFVRTNRFRVEPSDVDTLVRRRAALVAAVRAKVPGLLDTRLVRLADGAVTDTWVWDSAEHAMAAGQVVPTLPEAAAVFPLIRGTVSEDGEIID